MTLHYTLSSIIPILKVCLWVKGQLKCYFFHEACILISKFLSPLSILISFFKWHYDLGGSLHKYSRRWKFVCKWFLKEILQEQTDKWMGKTIREGKKSGKWNISSKAKPQCDPTGEHWSVSNISQFLWTKSKKNLPHAC